MRAGGGLVGGGQSSAAGPPPAPPTAAQQTGGVASAASASNHRALHKLLQAQLDSGRIKLPSQGAAAASKAPLIGEPSPEVVREHVDWLLAARRGTSAGPAAPAGAPAAAQDEEEDEAADAQAISAQMRAISRSLCSTVAGGAASGTCAYSTSSARDAYRFDAAAVAAMKAGGELSAEHHRRRDAQTAYLEAAARDAGLRRGAPTAPK